MIELCVCAVCTYDKEGVEHTLSLNIHVHMHNDMQVDEHYVQIEEIM